MEHSKHVVEDKLREKRECAFKEKGGCAGRLTLHRAVSYAGKRIQEPWAWVWLCAKHHGVDDYQGYKVDEAEARRIAMRNAPEDAKERYPRLDWEK